MKKFISCFIATIFLFTMVIFIPVSAENVAKENVTIQILATSDTHGRFVPYDYSINAPDNSGSLAQLATAIKAEKAKNPNTIVVDNGDSIQDNAESIFLDNSKNPNGTNPMIYAMNEIGYDIWNLGNHEFNFGMDTLTDIMGTFDGTVLCGNVKNPDGSDFATSYKIIEKNGVKIAIIGMVTPNITRWDSTNLTGYTVSDPVQATKDAIADATLDGADIFIAVEHMGKENEYDVAGSGVADVANECPELTAIIAGHAHSKVNESINGVLVLEPGKYGQNLAKLEIKLTLKDGKYIVSDKETDLNGELIAMAGKYGNPVYFEADADLTKVLKQYHEIALEDANAIVGELKGGDLVPTDEVNGIPTAQIQPTAMIDLINKVQMYYGEKISDDNKPIDVAAAAAFRSDANIKEGEIKKSDTALIYKYDNSLYVLEVTGKQLKQYMEWSAQYYNQYKDGDLTISFAHIPGYNYDMFTGVKYEVNISKEVGSRIENLTRMDGTSINDSDILRLAVNNYRASTNLLVEGSTVMTKDGVYPKLIAKSDEVMGDAGRIRDLIRDYIVDVKSGVITPVSDDNWMITGNDWDEVKRAQAVEAINSGLIELPASEDGKYWNDASVTVETLALVVKDDTTTETTETESSEKLPKTGSDLDFSLLLCLGIFAVITGSIVKKTGTEQ